MRPYLKKPFTKRAGVAQGVGHEFKPHHTHTHTKATWIGVLVVPCGEAKDAVSCATVHRTAPVTKNYLVLNPAVPRLRNLSLQGQ
jgi:hypothetical protein